MSGEDDNFDIDIYGDEEETQQQNQQQQGGDDFDYTYDEAQEQANSTEQNGKPSGNHTSNSGEDANTPQGPTQLNPRASIQPQQSLKRKAEDEPEDQSNHRPSQTPTAPDGRPLDPGALPSLKLSELHWWTTEEHIRAFCAAANTEHELRELAFGEHKINGKSRGEAYLEFTSAAAATATKREVERANAESAAKEPGAGPKDKFQAWYTPMGNPYRGKDGAVGDKKLGGQAGKFNNQGGAYNNSYQNRGNFGGGGRGGFNRGGYNNNNNMMGRGGGGVGGQWGMNGAAAGFQNPMMAGYGNMGGYGNMAGNMGYNNMMGGRGGMMNNMMGGGRGGFNGMNAMGMGNMGAMGGMGNMMGGMGAMGGMGMNNGGRGGAMMGRGGWNGGMGMGGQGMQGGGGGNKKPRME